MKEENNDTELIWKVLDQTLTESEVLEVKEKLKGNPSFKERLHEEIQFQSILLTAKELTDKKVTEKPRARVVSMKRYLVAASVSLVLLAATFLIFMLRPDRHEALFAAYFTPYESTVDVARDTENGDAVQGLYAAFFPEYANQNYERGIGILKDIQALDPDNQRAYFYLGHCYLGLDRTDEAIASFSYVTENEPSIYTGDASWFLALAYLKKGAIDSCKGVLTGIVEKKGFYAERAEGLLEELE